MLTGAATEAQPVGMVSLRGERAFPRQGRGRGAGPRRGAEETRGSREPQRAQSTQRIAHRESRGGRLERGAIDELKAVQGPAAFREAECLFSPSPPAVWFDS